MRREVGYCLGVACEIKKRNPRYLFRAMAQQNQGEGAKSSSRMAATKLLQPMLLQMEEKKFEVRRTITSFKPGEGDCPKHFQGSTMLFPIITSPLLMAPPASVAQAPSTTPVPMPQKKRVIAPPKSKS